MRVHAAFFAFVPEALHLGLPVLIENPRAKTSSIARRWCSSSVSAEVSAAFSGGALRPTRR